MDVFIASSAARPRAAEIVDALGGHRAVRPGRCCLVTTRITLYRSRLPSATDTKGRQSQRIADGSRLLRYPAGVELFACTAAIRSTCVRLSNFILV
jgi:hypothetical protein